MEGAEVKNIYISTSPLSNRIFAGHVLKDGITWATGKQDVTNQALASVCDHVSKVGEPVILSYDGKPIYEITVRKISEETRETRPSLDYLEERQ